MESNNKCKGGIPSNDEVIDELTKDLEATLVEDGASKSTESNPTQVDNSEEVVRPTGNVTAVDEECENDSDVDIEEDEIALRERESKWTDQEKQEQKEKSQKLKEEGNRLFSEKSYKEAASIYSQALLTCPQSCTNERSVMYANRAACRMKQEKKKAAIVDCTKALELNPNYLKALLRRAQLNRETEKLDDALSDYQRVLEIDGNILEARQAILTLPEEIKERNEKLKTEMLGKLKDLGNVILRPFGLSTENFAMVQDPNTGGYSINFQKNS